MCKDYIDYANQSLDLFNDHYVNAKTIFSALTNLANISLISDSMVYISDINNTEPSIAISNQMESHILALKNNLLQLKYRSPNMQAFVKDSLDTVEQLSELKRLYMESVAIDSPNSMVFSARFSDLLFEFDPAIYLRADLILIDSSQFKLQSRIRNLRLKEIYSK